MPTFRLQLSHEADELVDFEIGGSPPAVIHYAVVLRHLDEAGKATAVRVYDNSHGPNEHHMHRCDRRGDRQSPEIFHYGTPHEAMQEARKLVENGYEVMLAAWQR